VKVFLSGGYHYDPLHRLRLRAGLEFLRNRCGDPAFVAVEANRTLFQAVVGWQRQLFVELAQKDAKLSQLRLDELESLANTIHYEADSHQGLFTNNPRVVWLDDERNFGTSDNPCSTAQRYIKTYRKALEKENPNRSVRKVMQAISKFVTARAAKSTVADTFDRDKAWARMILRAKSFKPGYGIIVVGENHVQNKPSYLRSLLEAKGYECHVRYLANATTAHNNWATQPNLSLSAI
jgi:hypothetical protein